jgi:hypothetical protein
MNSMDIERRLRLPSPDEPAALPALILPSSSSAGFGAVRGRVHAGSAGRPAGIMSPRLALALLALVVVMVAAIAAGAIRLQRAPTQLDGLFAGRGVTLTYPDEWVRLAGNDRSGVPGEIALIVATAAVPGCSESDLPASSFGLAQPTEGASAVLPPPDDSVRLAERMLACLLTKPLAPGEIRLVLSQGIPQLVGIGPIESFDPADWGGLVPGASYSAGLLVPGEADGWTHVIDDMPAKLVVEQGPASIGADETRTWAVAQPGRLDAPWLIRATMRGPDLDALRDRADTVAQSLGFESKPPALVADRRDGALARVIDGLDRQQRLYPGSRLYGCFPRAVGSRAVTLEDGPGGPLLNPVDVMCETSVEETPIRLWRGRLAISWPAGDGTPAGEWGYEFFFGADGQLQAGGEFSTNSSVTFPGTGGEVPPLTEPFVIPVGSVVQLLPPGVDQAGPAYQSLYQHPNATIGGSFISDGQAGRRFLVVDGPVPNEGVDWYLVDMGQGAFYPASFGWLPATNAGRPLLRVVEPTCPADGASIAELLALIPGERVRCLGSSEITLDPVIASRAVEEGGQGVSGTPAWLADDTHWRLFGASGPDGVDGGLPVAVSPTVGDALPTNAWLTVRGHFDDPAGATCTRSNPEEWGVPDESPAIQSLRCRHLFVVTSFERRDAP